MSNEINPNLFPDGGYFYIEGDGSRHVGDSWRSLERRVIDYRARTGKPIGNPHEDIMAQVCARLPHLCRRVHPVVYPAGNHSLSWNQRVITWFAGLLGKKRVNAIARVPDQVAAERAEICKGCEFQKPLVSSCQPCLDSIRMGRKEVMDGHTSQHQNLQPCSALGEDCQTSVHIEQDLSDNPSLPLKCWRRKQ